jgi:hypothetical protein
MERKFTIRVVLAVAGFLLFVMLILPATRPPKARSQRISSVNHVSSVTLTLTNAGAQPAGEPGTNK